MRSMLLSCLLAACALASGAAGAQALVAVDVGGGAVAPVVAAGDYLYVGTGATISAWNMADPTHPVLAGRTRTTPAGGPISGLALVDGYLYAAWSAPDGSGGLSIHSLAAPAQPVAVASYDDYVIAPWKGPRGLASAGGFVYLGDRDNGLVVLDASDPVAPVTVAVASDIYQFDAMTLEGTRLLTSGSSFIGGRVLNVIDVTDPTAPTLAGSAVMDGGSVLRIAFADDHAIGVGNDLLVYDLADPTQITQVYAGPIDLATAAMARGDYLYLVGDSGVQVWDFSQPSAPAYLRTLAAPSFLPAQVGDTPFGPLILTRADRGLLLDATDAANPQLAASFQLPFGVEAYAAGFDATHAYFAENVYGLASADLATLAPAGRFDANLPPNPEQRAFEDIAVDGGRAYLASWGYGVIIADLADPVAPVELGRFAFPFASTIEAHGDRLYVASTTNGGVLRILDVSDPGAPVELGSLSTSQTYDLTVRGERAWLADGANFGDGGLRVVDVSDPAAPQVLGQYTDCAFANGVDVSADGATTWLACADGSLRILDTRTPTQPILLGSLTLPGTANLPDYNVAYSVRVVGDTAYVGNEYGLDEVAVGDPAAPAFITRHPSGYAVRKVELAPDGRVFAFAGEAGVYVFAPPPGDAIFANGFEGG